MKEDALKAGKEDPRKLIHSIKVGLALTLASLLYLLEPLFHGLGQNSIWAVITVIIVLQFTAGATLSKGINRGLGTLFAIGLAFPIQLFVSHIGHTGRAICIGVSVFTIACVDEYFQDLEKKDAAKSLKSSSLDNFEGILKCKAAESALATFASWEPRYSRYSYPCKEYVHLGVELRNLGYTAVALHSCLESQIQAPRPVGHQWSKSNALKDGWLNIFEAPRPVRALFREPCKHVAAEVVHVLKELAETIKTHHLFSPHISDHLHEALKELDTSIKTQPQLLLFPNSPTQKSPVCCWQGNMAGQQKETYVKQTNKSMGKTVITHLQFSEALSLAAFVSLLMETVARLELLVEEVEELGKTAHFEAFHEDGEVEILINSENLDQEETVGDSGNETDSTKIDLEAPMNLEKKVEVYNKACSVSSLHLARS